MRKKKGFTLIELMITIAILGILAAVAGPNLAKYISKAKTSEAVVNLKRLFDGSTSYYYRSQECVVDTQNPRTQRLSVIH